MIRLFFIILVFNLLVGCKTMKEGFSLQKKQAADEFLVEKKNPLVQPPEYGELPTPTNSNIEETKTNENEIEKLLGSESTKQQSIEFGNNSNKVEENILEKIKNR
tara:strand:+ start:88 stop:402 length:315 start_codon:yes stop_codon:yes gene_type:complete